MRDYLKTIEYFNSFIDEELLRVDKFIKRLDSGTIKEERRYVVKLKLHDIKLGILIAKYSRGDDLHLLKKEYLELLHTWEEVWEPEYYSKILKMLSLAVLFHADISEIEDLFTKVSIKDWLLQFLFCSLMNNQMNIDNILMFPETFSILQEVVLKEKKLNLLEKYLTNVWYNEECDCYEAHKSKEKIYYGYWSMEAGAIAKILNMDDSSLKGISYYPYDLVHFESEES